jgi:hypothetical protein
MSVTKRVIIVGGPRRGKSTLALELGGDPGAKGNNVYCGKVPIRCGDPLSKVKEPCVGVEYLPEGIPISGDDGAAQWVADNWFTLPGPWVCEGWVMARALRRWLGTFEQYDYEGRRLARKAPADSIIVLDQPAWVEASKGQEAMHKAVMTVWGQIAHHFHAITEHRTGQRRPNRP